VDPNWSGFNGTFCCESTGAGALMDGIGDWVVEFVSCAAKSIPVSKKITTATKQDIRLKGINDSVTAWSKNNLENMVDFDFKHENRLHTRIQIRMNDFLASGVEFKALMTTQ
jgi:hypothetical protein